MREDGSLISGEDLSGLPVQAVHDIILANTGMDVRQYKDDFFARQVLKRIKELHVDNQSYPDKLKADASELNRLIGSLTVHHTSFFRDLNKYRALKDALIPELMARKAKAKKIKIWSAGCASGEEPYSIAITFFEQFANLGADWVVDILASDINEKLLGMAREAVYSLEQLSKGNVDAEVLRRYFIPVDGAESKEVVGEKLLAVKDNIRKMVNFLRHNLIQDRYPERNDIIFCRNVLIYIKTEFNRQIITKFHDSLNEGGFLVLGNFEALDSYFLPYFERIKLFKEFVYRKITVGSDLYKQMLVKQSQIKAGLGI